MAAFLLGRIFMVFKSGRPQPADLALAAAFVFLLRPLHLVRLTRAIPSYVAFVGWVALINTTWALVRGVTTYALPVAFQVYSLALVALVFSARLASPRRFDEVITKVVGLSVWIQAAALWLDGAVFRAEGTFRQSNQLAYWGVCMFALYLSVQPKRTAGRDLLIIVPLTWAVATSTSRAGLVAFLMLAVAWLYSLFRHSRYRAVYFGALATAAVLATTLPAFGDYLVDLEVADHVENRFTKDSATGEVALRNSDRISTYPTYAFMGAGEGDFARFPHSLPIEIHSSPMTILFSYGIIGAITFGLFIFQVLKGGSGIQRAAVGAMLLYSVTHNGTRFTFFWITLAVIAAQPWVDAKRRRTLAASEAP